MSPENNQPTNQPELITGMPEELNVPAPTAEEPLLEAGNTDALLEAGETAPKVIDSADIPGDVPATEPAKPESNMGEFGGYTHLTTPTAEQGEENLRQMTEAAGPSADDEGDVSPVRPYVQQ